jgi:hypothetical protein
VKPSAAAVGSKPDVIQKPVTALQRVRVEVLAEQLRKPWICRNRASYVVESRRTRRAARRVRFESKAEEFRDRRNNGTGELRTATVSADRLLAQYEFLTSEDECVIALTGIRPEDIQ